MPQLRSSQLSSLRPGSARGTFESGERTITEMNDALSATLALQATKAKCSFCDWPGVEGTTEECRLASIEHRKNAHPHTERKRQATLDRKAKRLARLKAPKELPVEAPPEPVAVEEPTPSGAFEILRLRVDAVQSMPSEKRPRWTLRDAKAVDELLVRVAGE